MQWQLAQPVPRLAGLAMPPALRCCPLRLLDTLPAAALFLQPMLLGSVDLQVAMARQQAGWHDVVSGRRQLLAPSSLGIPFPPLPPAALRANLAGSLPSPHPPLQAMQDHQGHCEEHTAWRQQEAAYLQQ